VPELQLDELREYLKTVYETQVDILYVSRLDKVKTSAKQKPKKKLKGFGYGIPYRIEFSVNGQLRSVILETMRSEGFGHDHFSDRAQVLLWQHSAFNRLPRHAHSVDVGAFTTTGSMKSLGDCDEFFIMTDLISGYPYFRDLDRIRSRGRLSNLDLERCRILSEYLVRIHKEKSSSAGLYIRRIRDLLGHGEGIMGLADSYPDGLEYIDEDDLCAIEKRCVEWRWKLRRKTHRLVQVHGDYHPWNILFRTGTDFSVIDRSRGEWGESADDIAAMTINYFFYSLQAYRRLDGPFKSLFSRFWTNYLDKTGDEEILEVIQPFYAWRGLVIASPIWYPNLLLDVRKKVFHFIKNVLESERLDVKNINSYLDS
jgi:hypothetical protein